MGIQGDLKKSQFQPVFGKVEHNTSQISDTEQNLDITACTGFP